jgi:Ca2+-binding RTX toxin-like protein
MKRTKRSIGLLVLVGTLLVLPAVPARAGVATCFGQSATITGTDSDDVLIGTSSDDVIAALGGNDHVTGLEGDDLLCGGDGDDAIFGDPGDDSIHGDGGDDTVHLGEGLDLAYADLGFDRVYDFGDGGGIGAEDLVYLNDGNDFFDSRDAEAIVFGGPGNDTILDASQGFGGPGNDILDARGRANNDQHAGNVLSGGDGDDIIYGGSSNDTLDGGDGNDLLLGGDSRDSLVGGPGGDTLVGGNFDDFLDSQDGVGGNDAVDAGERREFEGDECLVDPGDLVGGCEF